MSETRSADFRCCPCRQYRRRFRGVRNLPTAILAALAFATISPVLAADAQRQIERTFAGHPGLTVELHNLAGNVTVVAASGSEVRLSATVHAAASSAADAERIASLLSVNFDTSGDRWIAKAVYPLDESRKYCYPRQAQEESIPWFLEWLDIGNSNFKYADREVRVVARPGGGALTLYADFRIEVPAGVAVKVKDGIGIIDSTGVRGAQNLDIATGEIRTQDGEGALSADSGSGDVRVSRQTGDVHVDTGSGDVRVDHVVAGRIDIDTGSGDIELRESSGSLNCDTGSGDIVASGVKLGTSLAADTGSGDVQLAGDFSAVTKIAIDTGSGDVTLEASPASATPQVRMAVSTGSGEITLDLPASRVTHSSHGDIRAEIGTATGVADISTGSGDVTLRTAR